jgi:ribA/ribD-fused uncharacterized protein
MIVFGKERDYVVHDDNNIKGFFGEYRWLSNFEPCKVFYEGIEYSSSENAYQAAKSLDLEIRLKISKLSPFESKKISKKIEIRPDWEEIKYEVMFSVVFEKFTRNKELKIKLLSTGNKYLEETNHWNDKFYGVCNGDGLNVLGKIIMDVRRIIRNNPNQKIGFFI